MGTSTSFPLLYFIGLKVFDMVLHLIPNVNLDSIDNFIDTGLQLKNIFAWVNQFIPTDILVLLLGLTATLVMVKFFYRLLMSVIGNIK